MRHEQELWRRAGIVARAVAIMGMAWGMVWLAPSLRADDDGQPARAVRLASVEGKVQVAQGGQIIASPVVANTPLFEGTQISAADDGRAEIQFEDGSVARLSPNSSLTLSLLRGQGNATETEMALESGLGYFERPAANTTGPLRIRFSDTVLTMSGPAVVRIDLDNPPGDIALFSGNAHLERASGLALDLHGGESVTLDGADPGRYNLAESIEPDSWDAWNADRDQALQSEYGARTGAGKSLAESGNPAWADLDANGNWYNVPEQGYVWSPYDASDSGWDPYGNGYWMWTPRFGYIWVSGNSWGYLPYQCGAWNFYDNFGWGWAPGGCQPWWIGGGGWISTIGNAPTWYRFPLRPHPHPGPHRPMPLSALSGRAKLEPYPLVPVNRRLSGVTGTLPARDRNVPAVIAGHPVLPMRPQSLRPQYNHSTSGPQNRGSYGAPGLGASGLGNRGPSVSGGQPRGTVPASSFRSSSAAGARSAGGSHPSGASSHPSSGGSASRSSGGGGGGGGSHASGGSSGGGGSHR